MFWRPAGSPHVRFRRMPVVRRIHRQQPTTPQEVQLNQTADLSSVLVGHRPLAPELVDNQRIQELGDALAVLYDDRVLQERLI